MNNERNGNSWNSNADNGQRGYLSEQYSPSSSYKNSMHKNKNSYKKNTNNSKNNTNGNKQQTDLLKELVEQNKTIIGLLRGIKFALQGNNPQPSKPTHKSNHKKSSNKETKLVDAPAEKQTSEESKASVSKQFVMRFDNKEPLNLDLEQDKKEDVEETPTVKETVDLLYENSVGEDDPFSVINSDD